MKLYAIRYGEGFKYGVMGTVYRNAVCPDQVIKDFPFLFYLAEKDGKYVLIDTGFRDEELAKEMGVTLLPVKEEIERFFGGIPYPDQVIITHSHWDHINNLDLYPDVPILMARTAYESVMESGEESVKKCLREGKVTLIDTEKKIDDIFCFQVIGGHTSDSSVLLFEAAGIKYVITGDECYHCDNVRRNIPIGICENAEKNTEFIEKMHCEGRTPLPFHDALIMTEYQKVSPNIVRIL